MSEYRLNYGNGQVSETLSTLKAARGAFAAQVRFDRTIQVARDRLVLARKSHRFDLWSWIATSMMTSSCPATTPRRPNSKKRSLGSTWYSVEIRET